MPMTNAWSDTGGSASGRTGRARQLDVMRDRRSGTRAVRDRIPARIAEHRIRSARKHTGRGHEAHPGRQPPSRAGRDVYVYGTTPPVAAGRVTVRNVPMTNDWSDTAGSASGCSAALVNSMSCENVAAGCELSVTAYVHESRNTASAVPASTRVAGANPTPDGSAPPRTRSCTCTARHRPSPPGE